MDKRLICLLLITFSLQVNARLPGWHGVDHMGIAVPDYDQAVDFLVNVIGCEQLIYDGPYSDPTGDWMQKQFEIEPRAILKKMGMLRCNFGSNIELFEWSAADQRKQIPRLRDIGANHIAFYVDDLDAAIDYLKSHGIEVLHEPLRSTTQPVVEARTNQRITRGISNIPPAQRRCRTCWRRRRNSFSTK